MREPSPADGDRETGSWDEWHRHVLISLRDLHKDVEQLKKEFWVLKGMSIIWGSIGGALAGILASKLL